MIIVSPMLIRDALCAKWIETVLTRIKLAYLDHEQSQSPCRAAAITNIKPGAEVTQAAVQRRRHAVALHPSSAELTGYETRQARTVLSTLIDHLTAIAVPYGSAFRQKL